MDEALGTRQVACHASMQPNTEQHLVCRDCGPLDKEAIRKQLSHLPHHHHGQKARRALQVSPA